MSVESARFAIAACGVVDAVFAHAHAMSMMASRRCRWLLSLLVLIGLPSLANAAELVRIAEVERDYVRPHERIDVGDGRRIHLFCMGEGSPTVILDAGLSDWSSTWALVQPAVARHTRTCSYDRPGMGYSDPAREARTPLNAVEDLHRLLAAARLHEPVVLVGHSLAGFYAKLFAVLHPERVAGLVLVDPAEERKWPRVFSTLERRFGAVAVRNAERGDAAWIPTLMAHFNECARAARAGPMPDALYRKCTDPERLPLGRVILDERRRLQATATYQETQAAELADSMYGRHPEADALYARLFARPHPLGAMPVLVLTHGLYDLAEDDALLEFASWKAAHRMSARLSTRGQQRMVPHSPHNMQVDRPAAVVDAILEVVATVRR